ncbi:MAG: TIGR03767 family metallophosphoesterase [Jatrophihabitantaceae bacterium]
MAEDDTQEHDDNPTGLSRRQLLGIGVAAAGVAAAGSLRNAQPVAAIEPAPQATPQWPAHPAGSTLARTLQHGPPGTKGYRKVVTGPGEPSVLRADLLGGAVRGSGNRVPVLSLSQLTDMHIVDAQSPARVEFLDRLNDPDNPLGSSMPFSAAYRAQEMLTAHVAEAMVQALNALPGGPVTGRPIDFTISTGDNSDNTQRNELRWHIDLLDGHQPIRPDSGSYAKWEGVGGGDDYDTSYWHPDGPPFLGSPDQAQAKYGFPTIPGLLNSCRAPFAATGLRSTWYTVFGNHDGLAQGNAPALGVISLIATGALKVTGLPVGLDVTALLAQVAAGDTAALEVLLTAGPAKIVTADSNRRMLSRAQTVAEHFNTTSAPVGHGYTQNNVSGGTAYYSFDTGAVHCISLDTVNPNGYSEGSIDSAQLAWLTNELKANSRRYLDASGSWVSNSGAADKLIVIFSHHTVATMDNVIGVDRVTGTTVANLLLQFPNVVLWVNGHTHRNSVRPHARPAGAAVGGGFWEVNTASHIDWPQQARVVEIVDNRDGTLSVFATIIDHAAPESWPASPTSPLALASLSRELGINDWQRDPETPTVDGRRGAVSDRNVELLVRAPFPVA